MKLQIHDLVYFLSKTFIGDFGFQNTLACQPTPDTLELNKAMEQIMSLVVSQSGVYTSKLKSLSLLFCKAYTFLYTEME